jgi:hypothetical protein
MDTSPHLRTAFGSSGGLHNGVQSTACMEGAAMTETWPKVDSDKDYDNLMPYPRTCAGFAIQWQCDLRLVDSNTRKLKDWWVDYATDLNLELEVAIMNKKTTVTLEGPAGRPDENWVCDLVACMQQNSQTGTLRCMRRLVVTKGEW